MSRHPKQPDGTAPVKRRRGRPRYVPTENDRKLVRVMLNYSPHETIAAVIGIDDKTLRRHFKDEIRSARETANANVVASLYSKATDKGCTSASVQAAIWWTKSRMRWKGESDTDPDQAAAELAARMFLALNSMRGPFVPGGEPPAVPNGVDDEDRVH